MININSTEKYIIFAKKINMVYKKNVNMVTNADNVGLSLLVEADYISVVACDNEQEVASIVSIIHSIDELEGENCCEILSVESVNSLNASLRINIMFRLQKFYYENLHDLGFRYFWFETMNLKIVEMMETLYPLRRSRQVHCYYVDLNKMFYH